MPEISSRNKLFQDKRISPFLTIINSTGLTDPFLVIRPDNLPFKASQAGPPEGRPSASRNRGANASGQIWAPAQLFRFSRAIRHFSNDDVVIHGIADEFGIGLYA